MIDNPLHNSLDFEKVVTIAHTRSKKRLVVEPASVVVSEARGERVRWVTAIPGARVEIAWKGTEDPFLEPVVSGGSQALSGLPRDKAHAHPKAPGIVPTRRGCRYAYTVTLTLGRRRLRLDPDVEIQP